MVKHRKNAEMEMERETERERADNRQQTTEKLQFKIMTFYTYFVLSEHILYKPLERAGTSTDST